MRYMPMPTESAYVVAPRSPRISSETSFSVTVVTARMRRDSRT